MPRTQGRSFGWISEGQSSVRVLKVLLCGYPPFFGDTDSEVLAKAGCGTDLARCVSYMKGTREVRLGNFNFNPADWKNVSEDAKTLIRLSASKGSCKCVIVWLRAELAQELHQAIC